MSSHQPIVPGRVSRLHTRTVSFLRKSLKIAFQGARIPTLKFQCSDYKAAGSNGSSRVSTTHRIRCGCQAPKMVISANGGSGLAAVADHRATGEEGRDSDAKALQQQSFFLDQVNATLGAMTDRATAASSLWQLPSLGHTLAPQHHTLLPDRLLLSRTVARCFSTIVE